MLVLQHRTKIYGVGVKLDKLLRATVFKHNLFLLLFIPFKLCEMVLLFAALTDLLTGAFLIWGILIIVSDLFTNRLFLNTRGIWWLILFLFFTGVTILFNYREGMYPNLVNAARTTILFLACYPAVTSLNREGFLRLIYHIALLVTVFIIVISIANIFVFLMNKPRIYYTLASAVQTRLGMQSGALYGFLGSSTSASFITIVALCCGTIVYILSEEQYMRIFSVISAIMQVITISIYNSRGGFLCLAFFVAGVSFFHVICKINGIKGFLLATAVGLVCATLTFASVYAVRYISIETSSFIQMIRFNEVKSKETPQISFFEAKKSVEMQNARSDIQEDVSNSRFFLWKTQLETVKENPVFGVGTANVATNFFRHIDQNSSKDYLRLAPNCHNTYLQVMVTNGIVGLALMILFLASILKHIWSIILKKDLDRQMKSIAIVTSALFCTYLLNGIFEYFFFTQQSIMSVMFWFFAGSIVFISTYNPNYTYEKRDFITNMLKKMRKT